MHAYPALSSARTIRAVAATFFGSFICLCSIRGPAETTRGERSFATTHAPTVTVSNADNISIFRTDDDKVSFSASSSLGDLTANDIKAQSEKDHIDIICPPPRFNEYIAVNLRVPANSTIYLDTKDNMIEIREPHRNIVARMTKEAIEISAETEATYDLTSVLQARKFVVEPGKVIVSSNVTHKKIGSYPPYIRIAAPTAAVTILDPIIEDNKLYPVTQPPLTMAAQMIALRDGRMSYSLRKSQPRLLNQFDKKNSPSPSSAENDNEVRLETHLVNLSVSVTDRDGKAISGLGKDDFSVYEDGVLQQITQFSPEQSPFNLILLLDTSNSVNSKKDLIKEAALHFIEAVNRQDKVAVVTFTNDVVVLTHLTDDRQELRDVIRTMPFPAGATSFYDALGYVLIEELRKVRNQRNAVVVLTDGEDNSILSGLQRDSHTSNHRGGSYLSYKQLLDGVREADALIYPIHVEIGVENGPFDGFFLAPANESAANSEAQRKRMEPLNAQVSGTAKRQLLDLADATGGRLYDVQQIEDLTGIYDKVAAELETIYSLAYVPSDSNFDGRFRHVRVTVKSHPDAVAKTRLGYFGS